MLFGISLKVFYHSTFVDKYIFISGSREIIREQLTQHIDDNQLAFYGSNGDLKFTHEDMLKREKDILGSN